MNGLTGMRMKSNGCRSLLILCMLLMSGSLWAASGKSVAKGAAGGLHLAVQAPALKNTKMFLGQYYMSKLYSKDSILLDEKGNGAFVGEEPLPEGLYVLYFSDTQYFDVMIGKDQSIKVQVDTTDLPHNVRFNGADETIAFYDYSAFLADRQKTNAALAQQRKALSEQSQPDSLKLKQLENKAKQLNEEVIAYQHQLTQTYKDGMLGVFIRGLMHPELPEFEIPSEASNPDSLKRALQYGFVRDHYLDSLNLSDERTFRTPYIRSLLDTYVNRMLVQQYDSIIPPAIRLVERSRGDEHCFQNVANYFLDYAVKSNMMGIDKLTVELGHRYYLSGLATWADSTLKANIGSEVRKIETSLVGMQAHNVALCDTLGRYRNLYDMCGDQITILFFFEPGCGHCKKATPKVRDFYEQYKDDPRINLIACYLLEDEKEWRDFIKEYHTECFMNVWDPKRSSYYWYWYDTSSTPMIYVLKGHTIFAKKIDAESLEMIAKYELK